MSSVESRCDLHAPWRTVPLSGPPATTREEVGDRSSGEGRRRTPDRTRRWRLRRRPLVQCRRAACCRDDASPTGWVVRTSGSARGVSCPVWAPQTVPVALPSSTGRSVPIADTWPAPTSKAPWTTDPNAGSRRERKVVPALPRGSRGDTPTHPRARETCQICGRTSGRQPSRPPSHAVI